MATLRWCLGHPWLVWGMVSAAIALIFEAALRLDVPSALAAPLWVVWWASYLALIRSLGSKAAILGLSIVAMLAPWIALSVPWSPSWHMVTAVQFPVFVAGAALIALPAVTWVLLSRLRGRVGLPVTPFSPGSQSMGAVGCLVFLGALWGMVLVTLGSDFLKAAWVAPRVDRACDAALVGAPVDVFAARAHRLGLILGQHVSGARTASLWAAGGGVMQQHACFVEAKAGRIVSTQVGSRVHRD
jgi:hypothetical protein